MMALIMYCCEVCAEQDAESCAYIKREEVRVMPDGVWLCEVCFDNGRNDIYREQQLADDDFVVPCWSDHSTAPECGPIKVRGEADIMEVIRAETNEWNTPFTRLASRYLLATHQRDELLAAINILLAFDSRAYVKQSTLAKDLLAAKKFCWAAIAKAEGRAA
jgi:hypothetical protein